MKLLFIFVLILASNCRAEPYTDAATRISFPDTCGGWQKGEIRVYPDKKAGFSIPYRKGNTVITVFVFSEGLQNIPNGADSAMFAARMQAIAAEIVSTWPRLGAKVSEETPIRAIRKSEEGKIMALIMVHRLELNGATYYSYSGLTGYRGRLLKIRCSDFSGKDVATGLDELGAFVSSLMDCNKDTLDPEFADRKHNQALLPTPTSVTDGADARYAPNTVTADVKR